MISDKTCKDGNPPQAGGSAQAHAPGQSPDNGSKVENHQHFDTDHLLKNLSGRTISSAFIVAMSQAVQFGLTLTSTMILARLLSPHDFGLVAMVYTVMSFLRVFKEAGLSTATIQREGITHAQVSNLFWINLGVSGLVSILMAAAAPLIAWFYREPRLFGPTLVLSSTFLLAGSVVQHQALLNRQMRFKAIALIQIVSTLVGILVGVGLAWSSWGVWSLVVLNLTTSVVTCLMTWLASRWRPQFFKRRSGTWPLLHFGANVTFGAFCYSIARGMDGLLIGRCYGAYSVGLYSRAAAMLNRPLEQFFYPMETVLIPVFSRLQNQPERYRFTYLQIYETIALFSMLFTGLLFAMSHPITMVLLGARWEKASVIFAAFTFAALQYPVTTATTWLLPTQGRGRDSMLVGVTVSLITVAAFVVGLPFGPVGVAFSYSIASIVVQMPLVYWLVGRSGPVKTKDLWFGFLKYLPVWGVVAVVAWLVRLPIPDNDAFTELLLATPAALLAGFLFIAVYPPARRTALRLMVIIKQFLASANYSKFPFSILDRARKTGPGRWLVRCIDRAQEEPEKQEVATDSEPVIERGKESALNRGFAPEITINQSRTEMRISALIPTYNRERTIARAIESILEQDFPPFEIVVVDDGSSDNTRSVVAGFGDRVRLVSQKNGGVSAARNRCVQEARGEWLAFLDSDDYWLPGHLRRMSEAIRATNGGAAIYFTDMRQAPFLKNGPSQWEKCGLHVPLPFELKRNATDWVFMPCQPMMFQTSLIRKDKYMECGGLPEELHTREDTLLFFKLGLAYPACAVSGCGAVLMDDGGNRLTEELGDHTLEYCNATILMYKQLARFVSTGNRQQRKRVAQELSSAYLAMARVNYRHKLFDNSLHCILLSGVANPRYCLGSCLDFIKSSVYRVWRDQRQSV